MLKEYYEKKIKIDNGSVIYIGKITEIFSKLTLFNIPENYKICTPLKFDVNQLKTVFSQAEIIRIENFKALKKQAEWMSGRYLIKNALQDILPGLKLNEIEVLYREEGAPYLKDFENISFSLSHSGNYSVLIFSSKINAQVAIDIEEIVPNNFDYIKKIALTASEIEELNNIKNKLNQSELAYLVKFYEIWTGKEAFLKYIKRGFHEPLKNIEISGKKIIHKGDNTKLELKTFIFDNHLISYIFSIKDENK